MSDGMSDSWIVYPMVYWVIGWDVGQDVGWLDCIPMVMLDLDGYKISLKACRMVGQHPVRHMGGGGDLP